MSLKIAVTGATGFVGHAAVPNLLARGSSVSALVRDAARANLVPEVRLVQGDLLNRAALDDLTRGADVVIHIAGVIGALSRSEYFAANEQGSQSIVEAAASNGVKRFVHISSLAAREPELSIYGASKKAGEMAVETFNSTMSVVVLRPPAVYGPGDRGTFPLIRALTQSLAVIPGNSASRFSLIYVDDLARIIVDAAEATRTGVFELNDGQPRGYSWNELAQIASAVEQKNITPVFLPRPVAMSVAFLVEAFAKTAGGLPVVSPDKIRQLYFGDWVARGEGWRLNEPVDFAKGLALTLAWYRREHWLPQRLNMDKLAA